MVALEIMSLLLQEPLTRETECGYPKVHEFPLLYARSKNNSVRTFRITVTNYGDYAILEISKRTTLKGKWVTDQYCYDTGVNIGKANETTYIEQALSVAQSRINSLHDAGFTEEMPTETFNTDAEGNMKPMLAIGFNLKKVKFPCIVQPKYDGVRCLMIERDGKVLLLSRKGKPYNIPHLIKWGEAHKKFLPLDGELYNHGDLTFQEIVSAVKRQSEITPKIKYVVYDRPIAGIPNDERLACLHEDFVKISNEFRFEDIKPFVYLSDDNIVYDEETLFAQHDKYVMEGYEGLIIRNEDGLYEFGFRSNNLIKLKKFEDTEFEIVNVVEATGRDAGTAIFVCKCEGGEFNVKPQGSRELRAQYFNDARNLIGKMVTVQYQGLSDDGIPRFPSAISVRDYE